MAMPTCTHAVSFCPGRGSRFDLEAYKATTRNDPDMIVEAPRSAKTETPKSYEGFWDGSGSQSWGLGLEFEA